MPQSSLVFVVIVAAWVVVLVPLWVANREAVGEARTADRDSEHLRVLDRRTSSPAVAHRSTTPLIHRSAGGSGMTGGSSDLSDSVVGSEPRSDRPVPSTLPVSSSASARRAAARRARVLSVLAAATVVSWLAVLAPFVPWWVAMPATMALVGDLVALVVTGRSRARERRRAAMAERRRAWQVEADYSRQPMDARTTSVPVEQSSAAWRDLLAAPDVEATEAIGGSTWTPIPVPRPTYMLKPVVHRPAPEVPEDMPGAPVPAAEAEPAPVVLTVVPDPAPAVEDTDSADDLISLLAERRPWEREHTWADDLDLMLARRRAVGS